MAELLAILEVYGTIGEIRDIIDKAKVRIGNAIRNGERAQQLFESFKALHDKLQPFEAAFKNNTLNIPNDKLEFFTEEIQKVDKTLHDTIESLNEKIDRLSCFEHEKKIDRLSSFLYRVVRANSTAEWFAQLEKNAKEADEFLGSIVPFLTIVQVAREEGEGTRAHMETITDQQTATLTEHTTDQTKTLEDHTTEANAQQTEALKDHITQTTNQQTKAITEASEDFFKPSFDVPQNPSHVVLNFPSLSSIKLGISHATTIEAKLKSTVLRQLHDKSINQRSNLSHTVGMEGMSGMGKSCALRGLVTDKDICTHFEHGLYYMSLGKDAKQNDVIHEISKIVAVSGGFRRSRDVMEQITVNAAVSLGHDWLAGKRILLLVDDVWSQNDILGDILVALSRIVDARAGSRVVFTTRDQVLTKGGNDVHFSERDEQVSLQILLAAANLEEPNIQPFRSKVTNVLQMCGGHPLALAIAGSAIKDLNDLGSAAESDMANAWDEYASWLQSNRQDLLRQRLDSNPYEITLEAAFSSSLSMLDEKIRPQLSCPLTFSEMYRSLVVLRRQGWLPLRILKRLWGTEEVYQTKQVLQKLTGANLARSDKEVVGLSIHDLQLDFVQSECKKKRELQKWHEKLVRSFLPEATSTESNSGAARWNQDIEDTCQDEYMRNNIARHLRNGGLRGELHALLKNPNWIVERLRKHEILGLEEDIGILLENTGQDGEEPESESPDDWAMTMIAKAARLCFPFVSRNQREVWFQLYARLLPLSERSTIIKRFIEDIERFAEKPWVKALTACLPHPGGDLESTVFCDGWVEWISGVGGDGKIIACGTNSDRSAAYVSTIKNGLMEDTVWTIRSKQDLSSASYVDGTPSWRREISAVCCKPDGTQFVTGHKDGSVQIWNADSGKAIGDAMCGHSDSVRCVSWSPDGTFIASGSADTTVLVWDPDSRRPICDPLQGHLEQVWSVAWAWDGRRLASASFDSTCRIWNVKTGAVEGDTLRGHKRSVICVAWSPNGSRLASGSCDRTVRIRDVKDGTVVSKELIGHIDEVTCVAWSPDGQRVASGSDDKTVRLWDAESGAPIGMWAVSRGEISCVEWSCDGHFVVSGSRGKEVRLWDVAAGISRMPVAAKGSRHDFMLYDVKFTRDGKSVVFRPDHSFVRVWDAETLQCLQKGKVEDFELADLFEEGAESAKEESYVKFSYAAGEIWYCCSRRIGIDTSLDMCLATLEHNAARWDYSETSRKIVADHALKPLPIGEALTGLLSGTGLTGLNAGDFFDFFELIK